MLNTNGLKDSINRYRTFDGAEFVCWLICPSARRVAQYRAAGVRCRRLKDELYVHHMDTDDAAKIDRAARNS